MIEFLSCPSCDYRLTPKKEKYCLFCHEKLNKHTGLFTGYQPKTLHGKIRRLFNDTNSRFYDKYYLVRRVYWTRGNETEIIIADGGILYEDDLKLITKCGGYVKYIREDYGTKRPVIRLGTTDDRM